MAIDALRKKAKGLFGQAVLAADPAQAVGAYLAENPIAPFAGKLVVLALGKAGCAMMEEALQHVPAPTRAIVVTNRENARDLAGVEVLVGGHPVPDAGSAAAGAALLAAVAGLGANDRVLALISGGGSALAIAPVAGVPVADKQAANGVLLGSGLDINQMNLVRQCLSRIKGGGLLAAAAPAQVTALILSDVIGDDLRVVASGPTVGRVGRNVDAVRILRGVGAWEQMPKSVRHVLEQEGTPLAKRAAQNVIVGSNRVSLERMAGFAGSAQIVDDGLTGDVGDAAEEILAVIRHVRGPQVLIFGGETTVKIKGDGMGGRNQELALRVALGAQDLPGDWVFMSAGTDGRDGPTDAAGGIVDAGTVQRMHAAGLDPQKLLDNNDSYTGLKAAGDLLVVGGTGTNVADVQVFLRAS